MEKLTAEVIWTVVLSGASAIVLLSNALEKIVKAVKAAKAPNVHQDERLDALEGRMDKVEGKLDHDNDRLKDIETGNRVTQRAILALLDHGIDGNNIDQMQHAKAELQEHLINR
jgi:hypothetical protein